MTNEVTSLTLAVDSRQVRTASTDLDKLSAAGKRSEQAAGGIESAFRSVANVFKGLVVADIGRRIVEQADAFTTLNARLKLVTNSAEAFTAAQRALFDIAQQTGTGLEQTSDLFGSLSRSTEALGVSQESVLGVTRTINQALVVSGTSAQSAAAALAQLGQGFAAGALRGEELNSVLEQAPRLARAIADGLGVSIGQLRQLGQDGKLTGEAVFQALQKSAQGIDAEFRQIPLTVSNASTQAANALLKLIGTIDSTSGATRGLAGVIQDASGFFGTLADQIALANQGLETTSGFAGAVAVAITTASDAVRLFAASAGLQFKIAGLYLGGLVAQIKAMSRMDVDGFNAISRAVKADIAEARAEFVKFGNSIVIKRPDLGQSDSKELARRGRPAQAFGTPAPVSTMPTKTPKSGGAGPEDLSGALRAADIAEIQASLSKMTAAYSVAEAIIEQTRSAGLMDEREYYAAKKSLIALNTQAQLEALRAENERIAKDKGGTGSEKIANQRKIADNLAKITVLETQAAGATQVLSQQQAAGIAAVARAYEEARIAAQEYLDTTAKQQDRELAGLTQSDTQRNTSAGLSSIEDKFGQQRAQIENDKRLLEMQGKFTEEARAQYEARLAIAAEFQQKETALYLEGVAKKMAAEGDWTTGAQRALNQYLDSVRNVSAASEGLFSDGLKGLEDQFVSLATTGKASFGDLANSIVAGITRIIVQQQLIKPMADFLQGGMSGGEGGGGAGSFFGSVVSSLFGGGRANGGPTSAGMMYQVNERKVPELLSVGGRDFLMMGAQGGRVTPQGAGGGGGQTVQQTNHFTISGPVDKRTQTQIAAAAASGANRALSRNG